MVGPKKLDVCQKSTYARKSFYFVDYSASKLSKHIFFKKCAHNTKILNLEKKTKKKQKDSYGS